MLHQQETSLTRKNNSGHAGFFRFLGYCATSRGPPVLIQPCQTGNVGTRAQVVQVPVRGGDGLVPHPRLDGPRVHATGQPQAGSGVPQVVDATALGGGLPVEGAGDGIAVQLGPHVGGEQQVVGALAQGEAFDDRQHPVGDGHPARSATLGGLHADALGSRAAHQQCRGRHLHEVTHTKLSGLCPAKSGPAQDEHHVGQTGVTQRPGVVDGFELVLGEGVQLDGRRGTLGHAHRGDGVGGDQLLAHAPGEEDRQAGAVAYDGRVPEPPRQQRLEGAGDLAATDRRDLQGLQTGGDQAQQFAVGLPGLHRDGGPADLEPAGRSRRVARCTTGACREGIAVLRGADGRAFRHACRGRRRRTGQ